MRAEPRRSAFDSADGSSAGLGCGLLTTGPQTESNLEGLPAGFFVFVDPLIVLCS